MTRKEQSIRAKDIRRMAKAGTPLIEIAQHFGVSFQKVYKDVHGKKGKQ